MSTVGSRPSLRSTGTGVCTRKCYYMRLQEVSDYSILFCYGNMKAHVEKRNMLGWHLP